MKKYNYFIDIENDLRKLLSAHNYEACFSSGAWPHHKHCIPKDIMEFIANNPELQYSNTLTEFYVQFEPRVVELCRNEIIDNILLEE